MGRNIKVDDNVDVRNVEASAGHVRRDEDGAGLGLELVEAGQPLVLRHLPVERDSRETWIRQYSTDRI